MLMSDEIVDILKNEENILIVDSMCDLMKKEVLLYEMKRIDEIVPFINKGLSDTFKEDEILVVIRKNAFKSQEEMLNSDDYSQDYTFTLRTDTGRIIGEMIYDEEELDELHHDPNVYFLSDNFVTYSDQTTQGEKQFFVIESEKSTYITKVDLTDKVKSFKVAVPSVETDYYIKQCYNLENNKDLGSVIVGYSLEE